MEGQERILVIDDDEALQKSCRMVFSQEGYGVEPALDGISGLEKHKRFRPDLVLVDLKMPGLGGEISGQARRTILSMQRRIKALILLINDWLDLARIESGEILGSKEPVDLRAAVSEVIETLIPLADERQISLRLTAPQDLPRITGNKQTLLMLFTNLIHNGIKYNRQGGRVETELRRLDGDIEALIKDTGVGIPSEDLPLVFEQFYRVKGEDRTEGSGLGLSISRRIVEAHSGTIDVQSEPGKGTVFRVCLPIGSGAQ